MKPRVLPLLGALGGLLLLTLPTGVASGQSSDPEWLQWLNYHRDSGILAPVTHNADYDAPVGEHARYLVDLDQEGLCDGYPHCEAIPPGTPLGDEGSQNIIQRSTGPLTDRDIVEGLMAAPFHAMSMLRPGLTEVGFALYTNPDSGPIVSAGLVNTSSDPTPTDTSRTTTWPADGKTTSLLAYSGNETPDPLLADSCQSLDFGTTPNGADSAGLPIIVQFATTDDVTATIANADTGETLTACTAQPDDYPDDSISSIVLQASEAFLVIPEAPLETNTTYTVTVTGGIDLQFSFSTTEIPTTPPATADPATDPTTDPTTDPDPQPTATTPATDPDPGSPPPASPATPDSSTSLPWLIPTLRLAPLAAGLALIGVASLQAGRRRWSDAQASSTAVLGVGIALISPIFFVWGITRIGRTETLYRGTDLKGLTAAAALLVTIVIGSALADLSAERTPRSAAKASLTAILAISAMMIWASEAIGGVGFVAGASRRFGADAAVGPGPWAAIILAGIGLLWAHLPAEGAIRILIAPFRRLNATGPAIAIGLLTAAGVSLIVVARYLPWVNASAFGEDFDVPGRAVPIVGSSVVFGVFLVVAGVAIYGARRPVAGLIVGGTGSMLIVFPAAAAAFVSDQIVNGDVTARVADLAQRRFSVLEPSLNISIGPWMTFAGGLCCTLAIIALGWNTEVEGE